MKLEDLTGSLEAIVGAPHVARAAPRFDLDELPLATPGSVEEVSELLKLAARDRLRVIPIGAGSKLGWCAGPERADFVLSTRRLVGAVSHEPADGTISVRAGETMADLAARAERGGHRLTPDVAHPERCTIGGVVASGQSGSDRVRFGPVRHHVLGMQAVLGDGAVTRTGGQLVKNVTGFDLHRLYAGSHGTLCVITEVSLRLFPAPEHELWFAAAPATLEQGVELAHAARALPIRLAAMTLVRLDPPTKNARWALFARLFGKRAAVEAERVALETCWPGAAVVEGPRALESASETRDEASFDDARRPSFAVGGTTPRIGALAAELIALVDRRRPGTRVVVHPLDARIEFGLRDAGDPHELAVLARDARKVARAHGGSLHLRNAPIATLHALDPFGEEIVGLELMRELQQRLDPGGVFARGRFAGGL